MTWCLLIFVIRFHRHGLGLTNPWLREGYLLSLLCETKNEQELQMLLLGEGDTKVRPYRSTKARTVNPLKDLKG